MKKTMTIVVTMGFILIMALSAFAGTVERLRVNIPFDFYIDKEVLPAGEYIVEMRPTSSGSSTASTVFVVNQDRTVTAMILTNPGSDNELNSRLVFNKYGAKYFLSKVESMGLQANVRVSKFEKELRAQNIEAGKKVLVAQK